MQPLSYGLLGVQIGTVFYLCIFSDADEVMCRKLLNQLTNLVQMFPGICGGNFMYFSGAINLKCHVLESRRKQIVISPCSHLLVQFPNAHTPTILQVTQVADALLGFLILPRKHPPRVPSSPLSNLDLSAVFSLLPSSVRACACVSVCLCVCVRARALAHRAARQHRHAPVWGRATWGNQLIW